MDTGGNVLISQRDVDRQVELGGKFLRTLSTRPIIKQLLIGLGYSEQEHNHGWNLYLKMLGYMGAGQTPLQAPVTTAQQQALNDIDAFDEPAFRRANAALTRLHPEQQKYLFGDGLSAKRGPESVGSVQLFLDRYAALRDGTDSARGSSRDADKAAAATLEARNIVNPDREKQLRSLIETVKTLAPPPNVVVLSASEVELQSAALEFKNWLSDWRSTADAGVRRRDYRISLGISQRRARTSADSAEPAAAAADDSDAEEPAQP